MGRKVRGLQSARTHAKWADPRKVRGPMQSTRGAFWVRGALSAQIRAKCVGRGSIAWAALSAWAAIAQSGEWAALSTHLPRTCRAIPTQCNCGSTHVGRNEPQSSGTLRVNVIVMNMLFRVAAGIFVTQELAEICITSCVQNVWVVELVHGPAEIQQWRFLSIPVRAFEQGCTLYYTQKAV